MSDRLDHLKHKFVENVKTVLCQLRMLTPKTSEQEDTTRWYRALTEQISVIEAKVTSLNLADDMAKVYYDTLKPYFADLKDSSQTAFVANDLLFTAFGIVDTEPGPTTATAHFFDMLKGDDSSLTNVWQVLTDLYRTAILLRIYASNDNVKEIVSLLLNSNVSLSKHGLANLKNFKSKLRMKHLLQQTLRDGTGKMDTLLEYLKQIAETFQSDHPELKTILDQFDKLQVDEAKQGVNGDASGDLAALNGLAGVDGLEGLGSHLDAFMSKLSPELMEQVQSLSREWGLPIPTTTAKSENKV